MESDIFTIDDVALWRTDGAVHIRTNDPHGDPVELNADQVRELAAILLRLAQEI
jgi:hypothetical protein